MYTRLSSGHGALMVQCNCMPIALSDFSHFLACTEYYLITSSLICNFIWILQVVEYVQYCTYYLSHRASIYLIYSRPIWTQRILTINSSLSIHTVHPSIHPISTHLSTPYLPRATCVPTYLSIYLQRANSIKLTERGGKWEGGGGGAALNRALFAE